MSRRDSSTDRSDCRGSIGFMGRAGRCTSIADHYRPAVPKRKARSRISLIMCTGGEHHGARSAFQRRLKFPDQRIAPPADVFKRNAGLGFAATAFDLQPAIALRDRWGWLRWSCACSCHSDRPCFAVGAVRLAHGLFGAFACTHGANCCAGYPRAKEVFARFGAHGAYCSEPCDCGQCH